MKQFAIAAALFAFVALAAEEVAVNGAFTIKPQAKYPTGWVADRWIGYQPEPKFEIIQENGRNVVHFTEIGCKNGFSWCSSARPAVKAGDVLRVTAKIKGKGKARFGLETFIDKRKWLAVLPKTGFDLTPEWKDVKVDLVVKDKDATQKVGFVMLTFGATSKADFYISDLKAELVPAEKK